MIDFYYNRAQKGDDCCEFIHHVQEEIKSTVDTCIGMRAKVQGERRLSGVHPVYSDETIRGQGIPVT